MNLYGFVVPRADGGALDLWDEHGRVVLVAALPHRASPSPRAEGLQRLAQTFGEQGLTVIGIPVPDGAGTAEGAGYGVSFPVTVPQDPAGGVLSWLVSSAPTEGGVGIVPPFTRFLVGRDGTVIARFPADGDAKELIAAVQHALAQPVPPTPERPAPAPELAAAPDQGDPRAPLPAVLDPAPVGPDGREILEAELVPDDAPADGGSDGTVDERLARLEEQVAADRLEAELAHPAADPSTGEDLQDLSDDLRDLEIDAELRRE